ncbi:MAG: hypothetical protein GY951_06790 [Psychromonas sp.]|nr:hypothetical protein [Alteromonadales bacterium]MCP5077750.1 hypothetical protein [Psychromonas sp.]
MNNKLLAGLVSGLLLSANAAYADCKITTKIENKTGGDIIVSQAHMFNGDTLWYGWGTRSGTPAEWNPDERLSNNESYSVTKKLNTNKKCNYDSYKVITRFTYYCPGSGNESDAASVTTKHMWKEGGRAGGSSLRVYECEGSANVWNH